MTTRDEIAGLRALKRIEIERLQGELDALDKVEAMLTSQKASKPEVHMFVPVERMPADLGPRDVVIRITESNKTKWWNMEDMVRTAEAAGRDIHAWKNPKNSLSNAAILLWRNEHRLQRRVVDGRSAYRYTEPV